EYMEAPMPALHASWHSVMMVEARRNGHERDWAECVVHDLRQPASALRAAAELLVHETAPERRERLVTMVVRDTQLPAPLAADLLEALTTSRAGFTLQTSPADLGDVAREAAESCAFSSSRRVKLAIEDELPSVRIDRARIAQVFANLLRNADQHAVPGTPITVGVKRVREALEARVENQ